MIDRVQFSTDAGAGGAGTSVATGYSPPIQGEITAVYVEYEGSPPATTDFTLSDESDPAAEAIVTLTNSNTNTKLYPRRVLETNDGTNLTYDGTYEVHGPYVVHGRLKAAIAQADPGDTVTVTVWYKK